MASIFTYDPDPPRVASPWLQTHDEQPATEGTGRSTKGNSPSSQTRGTSMSNPSAHGVKVVRLQAEPQEGPVEYKLHLLLRPRRKFISTSTATDIPGSMHSSLGVNASNRSYSESTVEQNTSSDLRQSSTSTTLQTRQHRLQQLTTQLLWRLQQSSPHHSSSATNYILPSLPEALPELKAPTQPAKLLHGLEESQGALYEIGVSDDGTLVGLAEDEMQESLNNLRAMAACLGCTVEILRQEVVGRCEWVEDLSVNEHEPAIRQKGVLVVVEALVKPWLHGKSPRIARIPTLEVGSKYSQKYRQDVPSSQSTEQLRITLLGPTMSGKSSLLGTLTTSTLDNGRGKSRLSMLKHRHEITSGMTSSVTQELLGYHDTEGGNVEIINYATENMPSWIDIHSAVGNGRLVFLSDSAGHPRYRRTTVRGLVGWTPHYTLLCVPADDTEDTSGKLGSTQRSQQSQQALGVVVPDMDLSSAQLDLCLRLDTPLVVVVTKLDLASRAGLKSTLTKILDALKIAGRKPAILPHTLPDTAGDDLRFIASSEIESAYTAALPLLNDPRETVPIILTSAVQGTGIGSLHALLHELPIPPSLNTPETGSITVFHVEDVYAKLAESEGVIVSGRMRCGRISVGDSGLVGPFSIHEHDDSDSDDRSNKRISSSHLPTSRSFPGALRNSHLTLAHLPNQEWRRFKVNSIRNLRLPVLTLEADEVGTIAIVPDDASSNKAVDSSAAFARIRKGMVLSDVQRQSTRTFVAEFKREDLESLAVGNHVVVYIASVRASARVVSARAPDSPIRPRGAPMDVSSDPDHFGFESDVAPIPTTHEQDFSEKVAGAVTASSLLVTLHFDTSKEFVMVGDQVLVMPGGGPGLYGGSERGEKGIAGLEGFVGKVIETFG